MKMPSLGFGTYRLKGDVLRRALDSALSLGYRHIDTAQIYGNEADIGAGLTSSSIPRNQLYLTTKVWFNEYADGRLIPSLEKSLERLQTDQVDLTLIHWPSPGDDVPMATYLEQLAEARERGLTREIGVSNFTIAQLEEAIDILGEGAIVHQQIEVHPLLQNRRLRTACAVHDIAVTAYMPLAYGKVLSEPSLQEIAARHAVTPAQIALAWLLQQEMAVIPSSTNPAHQKANLQAQDLVLSDEEMQAIAGLDRGVRCANPDFAPKWD